MTSANDGANIYIQVLPMVLEIQGGVMMYSFLKGKIVERGMKQCAIADALGITPRALSQKIAGKRAFKWDEVCAIQSRFFPDIDKDTLFAATEEKKGA